MGDRVTKNLLQTYFKQAEELPLAVREAFQRALPEESIRVYALSDLDGKQRFSECWLILGERHLVLAEPDGALKNGHTTRTIRTLALNGI